MLEKNRSGFFGIFGCKCMCGERGELVGHCLDHFDLTHFLHLQDLEQEHRKTGQQKQACGQPATSQSFEAMASTYEPFCFYVISFCTCIYV